MALTEAEWVIANAQDYWQSDEWASRYYIEPTTGRVQVRHYDTPGILVQDTRTGYVNPDYAGTTSGPIEAQSSLAAGPSFARLDMPEAGQDLRDLSGGDLGGGDVALANAALGPLVAGGGAMLLSRLLAMVPAGLRTVVGQAIRALGGVGQRIGWNRLPTWVQQVLIFAGVTAGLDIVIDTGPDDRGLIQLPGTSDLSIGNMAGIAIVGRWTANGVQFVKLSDGRLGARNKRGMWKFWRPKKPIVLFAGGAKDIRTFLRADTALNKQAQRLKKALGRRAPGGKRAPKAVQGQVIAVDGQRIIRNG